MIKACLFDLDGTLLDTLQSLRYYVNKTMRDFGYDEITIEETKIFVGKGSKNLILRSLEKSGMNGNLPENVNKYLQIHDKFMGDYNASPYYLTEPYDGITELIDVLFNRGLKLAVISNKPHDTTIQLVKSFFPNRFEIIEGQSERFPTKPDPTLGLDILSRLGVSSSEVAYFGDTDTDMKTGVNLGVSYNVGVLWGFRTKDELIQNGATHTVSHPSEVIDIILK